MCVNPLGPTTALWGYLLSAFYYLELQIPCSRAYKGPGADLCLQSIPLDSTDPTSPLRCLVSRFRKVVEGETQEVDRKKEKNLE